MARTKERKAERKAFIKVGVMLTPTEHRAAKHAAIDAGQSMQDWIASLVTRELARGSHES